MGFFNRTNKHEELKELIKTNDEYILSKIDNIIINDNDQFIKLNKRLDKLEKENKELKEIISTITESPCIDTSTTTDKSTETPTKDAPPKHSRSNNTTGVKRVTRSQGNWVYQYYTDKGRHAISRISIQDLEQVVKSKGLPWVIANKEAYDYSKSLKRKKRRASNQGRTHNELYEFGKSYKEYNKIQLTPQGWKFRNGNLEYPTSSLLYIFYNVNHPFTIGNYKKLDKNNSEVGLNRFMQTVYAFNTDFRNGKGHYLDTVFEIFSQDYEVPFFIEFGYNEDGDCLLINGKSTSINRKQLKGWVDKLNDSFDPHTDIVLIMHDNPTISKKYLFWTLMNYGNEHILKIINGDD